MCRVYWLAASAALLVFPASALCQQQGQTASQGQSQDQTQTQQAQTPASQQDSLAAAARRAREQKKDAAKPAKVLDNDNLPDKGGISTVGAAPAATAGDNAATPAAAAAPASPSDEKSWRDRFATLRHKLEQDQAELDVMQRELGVLNLQYYPDPVKAMQQDLTRSDINKKTAGIEDMKKKIEADKQAISDAEDDLRKAGGDSGWAR
jgi:small-conductance mechanosensitive channel